MDANASTISLRPLIEKNKAFNALLVITSAATLVWLFYCFRLLTHGHILFGTSSYGPTWGISVAHIVHLIGISHVGIAISATVRVLNLSRYRNLARLAEWMTLVALTAAVVQIALDVGRPDRFITQTILHGRWHAPMVWSMTVIFLYFALSSVYLYLSMRKDLWTLSSIDLPFKRLYRWLALGYNDTQEERTRQTTTLYWLAIVLVPIMISVHSVYGLFFGLLPAKAGWFNPLQAPYFVLGAIVSGFSAIIVVAALLRWAYAWKQQLPDRLFNNLGAFLAFFVFLFLYFLFCEHLTFQYSTLAAEKAVSDSLLFGRFAGMFWSTTLVGLVIPFGFLFVQAVGRNDVHVGWTAVAALAINGALWWKRFLLVIPSQNIAQFPLPRPLVDYAPSLVEWVVTFGSVALSVLLFLGLLKVLPVLELPSYPHRDSQPVRPSRLRGWLIWLTWTTAILLISWGIFAREQDHAPAKWLTGLALLVAIPLAHCLIRDPADRHAMKGTNA